MKPPAINAKHRQDGSIMEWLPCKACGADAILPMEVSVSRDGDIEASDELYLDLEDSEDAMPGGPEGEAGGDGAATGLPDQEDQESRLFTCHVCGDNWLSIKEEKSSGSCEITFIHQMGISPVMRRVAHMATHVVLNESTVDKWDYFIDDDEVDEELWMDKLQERRKLLKSACTN